MTDNSITYWIKFYFYAYYFFIKLSIVGECIPAVVPTPTLEVNLLDQEESVMMDKPSQTDAMARKAMLGLSAIPKEHKKKIIGAIICMLFFLGFGIVDFIYTSVLLIKEYNIIGWILLDGVLLYLAYLGLKSVYLYFKTKQYLSIVLLWDKAKRKSELKLQCY